MRLSLSDFYAHTRFFPHRQNRLQTLISTTRSAQFAFAGAILLLSALAFAQPFPNLGARDIRPPTNGEGAVGDSFGARVAVCDGELLVAATGDQTPIPTSANGQSAGSVHRFQITASGLVPLGKIPLPGVEQSALFGISLSCDANELFIGAPGVGTVSFDSDAGTVFRYRRVAGSWQFNGEVPGARPVGGARFGFSTALNQGVLVVGAPGESAAYLYRRTGFSLSAPQRLQGLGLPSDSNFGLSVALSGENTSSELAIAAPGGFSGNVVRYALSTPAFEIARITGQPSFGRGLAYLGTQLWIGAPDLNGAVGQVAIYDVSTGAQVQILNAPNSGGPVEQFGEQITSFGNSVSVSAPAARLNLTDGEGAAHLYAASGGGLWQLDYTLRPPARGNSPRADAFGNSVAIAASGIYVGAPYSVAGGHPTQGLAYRFSAQGIPMQSVDSGRGAAFDRFGSAIALSQKPSAYVEASALVKAQGEHAIVGAFLVDSPAGVETGEAYVYRRGRAGWQLEATLSAPDVGEEQRFGVSVDIDGDLAVVGSYWDVVQGVVDAGSAYVFERVVSESGVISWQFLQKLVAPQPRDRAFFGFAVAIDGNRIAVGARGDSESFSEQGGIVFFKRDRDGVYQAGPMLRPADSAAFDTFGAFIDLSGDTALVGAPGTARKGIAAGGRAYLLNAAPNTNNWSFSQTLSDPNGVEGDGFGFSIALENAPGGIAPTRAYIGTPFSASGANPAVGHALEFRPPAPGTAATDWAVVRRIDSPITLPGTQFATSLAAHPDGVVIGAIGVDSAGLPDIGAGFLAPHLKVAEILPAPPIARAATGRFVAASPSGIALFAAPGVSTVNPQEGAVFELLGENLFGDGFED